MYCRMCSDHPNREQYDQYEQQWRQYEEQMSQKREYIQSRKQALLDSQQQATAATSQPAMPLPGASFPASLPASAAPTSFSAPPSIDTSAAYSSAMYGAANSQLVQSEYPYPGAAAGQPFPPSAPGYSGHMSPFQPGGVFSPAMPAGGPRLPAVSHDSSGYPPGASGPAWLRPGFPGARPPFGAAQTAAVDHSEGQKGFEEYKDGKDSAAHPQFLHSARPPFEAAGGRPPFGQQLPFRGPRPRAPGEFGALPSFQPNQQRANVPPNEFGVQAAFQQNQPRAGIRQSGPRPGFGPRPGMFAEGGETSADAGDVTESEDQMSGVPPSQFGSGFGGPGFGRGMRPGMLGMGPRAGFPPALRPMGMMPRPQAPTFSEETANEEMEESGEWPGDETEATVGTDFGPRGIRPEGPRFPTPGFPGHGDVRGPPPRAADPRMMLRPGDPRAALLGGLPPRGPRPLQPWLFGAGRGAPQWEQQDFGQSAAEEEYDENVEFQEGAEEEDASHEEGFGEDFEGDENFEQGVGGFGSAGFGPRGFPPPQFGGRLPRFGMERPGLDMRGPRPGFGPGVPGFGFGAGMRPRAGPVPLMAIQLPPSLSKSKDQSNSGQEAEENVGEEEEEEAEEEYTEESDQFAEQTDVACDVGPRMPFRPPFPPGGPRGGFPPDQRLRPPGAMLGVPPRGMPGARGGRWPRPGFGERFPPPGFRGPVPRFPRMPGLPSDTDFGEEFGQEGGFEGTGFGFGDVPEEDYLAAEAEQWGEQQTNNDGESMGPPGNASDMSAGTDRYLIH